MTSVPRMLRQYFIRPLYRHVSLYALEQIQNEFNRMLELGDFALNKCGCVLLKTHGLPCACYLQIKIGSHGALYLDDIHEFWSTLRYTEVGDEPNEEVRNANANDKEYFQSLVDEVLKSDPAFVRRMAEVLEYELHPDGADIPEPYASPPRKGRPSTSKTMRRRKSSFEYSRSSSRGRGSRSSSRGRSSGRSSGRETQSSVGIKFSFNLSDDPGGRDFSQFPWPDYIPFMLPPYLFDWIDVLGDGNCGFRAIAVTELGGEEAWPILRRAMSMEMQMNRAQYLTLYLSHESLDESIFRVGSHTDGPAPFMHWFDAPMAFYSAATFLNIAIAFYGSANGDSLNNCLILPLRKSQAARSVNKLIHILWVNRNHFVQLFMNDDSSPLPPIHPRWKQAADNFAKDLDTNFTTRIMLWNNLRGAPPPTNNTADDAVNLDTP
ncbi:uncharacterized protein LOC130798205 [Amaranthus tricolor]|uniref:uncharacterized protein LOC130798205 n=2 Tax=Amaranthus tricolor TaxID=29722 RepID=UPI002584882A|nr:uncharacterized protein LOC130798205 [Amaranthus tricolor]